MKSNLKVFIAQVLFDGKLMRKDNGGSEMFLNCKQAFEAIRKMDKLIPGIPKIAYWRKRLNWLMLQSFGCVAPPVTTNLQKLCALMCLCGKKYNYENITHPFSNRFNPKFLQKQP
jgi:hypothetical protein